VDVEGASVCGIGAFQEASGPGAFHDEAESFEIGELFQLATGSFRLGTGSSQLVEAGALQAPPEESGGGGQIILEKTRHSNWQCSTKRPNYSKWRDRSN
jgi:hypothetical protein